MKRSFMNSIFSSLVSSSITLAIIAIYSAPALAQVQAQAQLTWTDLTNEDSYLIERSSGGAAYASVGTVGANVTGFSDPGPLALSVEHCYRVTASNAFGPGPASVPACGTPNVPGQVIIQIFTLAPL